MNNIQKKENPQDFRKKIILIDDVHLKLRMK